MTTLKALAPNAWLGIGGNVGNVLANMQSAIGILNAHEHISVLQVSPLYKTPPWGFEDQDWFFNACFAVSTSLDPKQLLQTCLDTERQLKRERIQRWGPRTIDLDVLIYNGIQSQESSLTLPHPRMHERAFVIVPLSDIAPDLELKNRTISQWKKTVDKEGIEIVDGPRDWWEIKR